MRHIQETRFAGLILLVSAIGWPGLVSAQELTQFAQAKAVYQRQDYRVYRVTWETEAQKNSLLGADVDLLHVDQRKKQAYLRAPATAVPLRWLRQQLHVTEDKAHTEKVRTLARAATFSADAGAYHTYAELQTELTSLVASNPEKARLHRLATIEGKDILAIEISNPLTAAETKPEVIVLGCHHAREWISVEIPLLLARELLGVNPDADPAFQAIAARARVWIIPMVNPAGHDFTVRVDRLWRKNLRNNGDGTFGVDLNRNYGGPKWDGPGSSSDTSSDTYRGPAPFSEVETQTVRNLVTKRHQEGRLRGVLSYHSFSQLVLFPWGYTTDSADPILASLASQYAARIPGRAYEAQQASRLYIANGDLGDWVWQATAQRRGTGVPPLTVELRPREMDEGGFILPEDQIEPTWRENKPAILATLAAWSQTGAPPVLARAVPDNEPADVRDVHLAINRPDEFAWKLFMRVNSPADRGKPIGEGPLEWESWALAKDVHANPNQKPAWPGEGSPRFRSPAQRFEAPRKLVLLAAQAAARGGPEAERQATFAAEAALHRMDDREEETRMNRAAFDYVVNPLKEPPPRNLPKDQLATWQPQVVLYNVEGQEAMLQKREPFNFPPDAAEIKAQWRRLLSGDDAKRYYTIKSDGQTWGLTALHITTKHLPNWFWATFEHQDNPWRESVLKSRDRSAGLPTEWKQTVWGNYVLRGTQVDFQDSLGRPTLLANSRVETGFEDTSSCITCHARATIGPKPRNPQDIPPLFNGANRLQIFASTNPDRGAIGSPDPKWFGNDDSEPRASKYWQMDFVWSLMRAKRKGPPLFQATPAFEPIPAPAGSLVGKWHYRSIKKDSVDFWVDGELDIVESAPGTLKGTLSVEGEKMELKGTIVPGDLSTVRFRGEGITPGAKDWVMEYTGYLLPFWAQGKINTQAALSGTLVRAKERPGYPAGYVALWVAVKIEK